MGEPDATGATRRRRGEELERAIFDAVWAELAAVGYDALTMEGVAARAQTGKQVLYRRWPNRLELVLGALRDRSGSILDEPPDTGSLRGDATFMLRRMADRQEELGADGIRGLLRDALDFDPSGFIRSASVWTAMVEHAAKRGEIGPATVPPHVIMAANEVLRHRLLTSREPVSDEEIAVLVEDIFLPLIRFHAAGAHKLRSYHQPVRFRVTDPVLPTTPYRRADDDSDPAVPGDRSRDR
jgi:AcrR family transcriptional regulator